MKAVKTRNLTFDLWAHMKTYCEHHAASGRPMLSEDQCADWVRGWLAVQQATLPDEALRFYAAEMPRVIQEATSNPIERAAT